jgi:uncharacterized glyoxalase superfamily protein PhnB
LLPKGQGTLAVPGLEAPARDYRRHWTPIHFDVVVEDFDAALGRALEAGAALDQPVQVREWGRMANLADVFGHGFCLLEFVGKGYYEVP